MGKKKGREKRARIENKIRKKNKIRKTKIIRVRRKMSLKNNKNQQISHICQLVRFWVCSRRSNTANRKIKDPKRENRKWHRNPSKRMLKKRSRIKKRHLKQ